MTNGFSTAVAKLFRSLHRKHDSDDGDASKSRAAATALLAVSGSAATAPRTVIFPSGFTRQVRHLVDYVTALTKLRATAPASTRRHAAAIKALDRVAMMLRARERGDSSARAVPLNAAVALLVNVWECVLQCLDLTKALAGGATPSNVSTAVERLSSSSSGSSAALDEPTRLDLSARTLLSLLVQQKEFDFALMVLGHGDCNVHRQHEFARKRSFHAAAAAADRPRAESRDELRVNMRVSRRGSIAAKPRQLPTKNDVASTSDASLCQLVKKTLDLHQATVRALQTLHAATTDEPDDANDRLSNRALLAQVLAAAYVRVPILRETIQLSCQDHISRSYGRRRRLAQRRRPGGGGRYAYSGGASMPAMRSRSATILDEVNVALFRWTNKLHPKCQSSVAPFHRDSAWAREASRVTSDLQDPKFQRLFIALLIDHFLVVAGSGGIEWKSIPGAAVLKDTVLTMTEAVFQIQLRAAEASLPDVGDPSASEMSDDSQRQSFSLEACEDWTVGVFLKQSMRMLASNTPFIHDWLQTILVNTNYLLPHHVALCMRYLSQLMDQFPAYFASESVDDDVLRHVFARLLGSEHFEILRTTELFVMKHFTGLSVTLRESLVALFAAKFQRLFLHWNRDVRFCYYHILLYLTYPGNRLVLGAKSDELLMGPAAAHLFEIPGLVRGVTKSQHKWEVFDTPLCELIAFANRKNKQQQQQQSRAVRVMAAQPGTPAVQPSMTLLTRRPGINSRMNHQNRLAPAMVKSSSMPSLPVDAAATAPVHEVTPAPEWIETLPFTTIQRSMQEYRRHVETYFYQARMLSVHDPVPPPTLEAAKRDAAGKL